MSDPNRTPDNGKPDPNDVMKLGARTIFVWLAIVLGIIFLVTFKKPGELQAKTLSYPAFMEKVRDKQIPAGFVTYSPQTSDLREITGTYYELDGNGKPLLDEKDGQLMGFNDARKIANSGRREESTQRVMKSLWDAI